jgi:hypothetical protein
MAGYMLEVAALISSWYQHSSEMTFGKKQHVLATKLDIEQQFIQLDSDLIEATKEAERDSYETRNQQLQTIIVASSVMFAALSTVIIQGVLPQGTTPREPYITLALAISGGLSFTALFLCIVFCVELLMKASRFMIKRSSRHKGKTLIFADI